MKKGVARLLEAIETPIPMAEHYINEGHAQTKN
jgi:hypothetical protein